MVSSKIHRIRYKQEILVEVLEEHAPEVASILKTTMEQAGQAYLSRVPVVADVRIALSWATS